MATELEKQKYPRHIHVSVTEESYQIIQDLCSHKGDFTHILRTLIEDFAKTKVKMMKGKKDAQKSPAGGAKDS